MAAPKGHKGYPNSGTPATYTTEIIEKLADEFKTWLDDPSHVWFKDFCLDNNINPDLMSEWAKKNTKFAGVYEFAKHRQESRLINGGLESRYNGSIVKLVLFNAHNWSDRTETKLSGDSQNPIAFLLTDTDGTSKDLVKDD